MQRLREKAWHLNIDPRVAKHMGRDRRGWEAGGWQVREGVVCPVKEVGIHLEGDEDPVSWLWPLYPNYQCESHLLVSFSVDTLCYLCPGPSPCSSARMCVIAVNFKEKGNFGGSRVQKSPQKARESFPTFKTGQCLCIALGHQERYFPVLALWYYTRSFWLPVMETFSLA